MEAWRVRPGLWALLSSYRAACGSRAVPFLSDVRGWFSLPVRLGLIAGELDVKRCALAETELGVDLTTVGFHDRSGDR